MTWRTGPQQAAELGDADAESAVPGEEPTCDLGVAARPGPRGPAAGEEIDMPAGAVRRRAAGIAYRAGKHHGRPRAPARPDAVGMNGDNPAGVRLGRGNGDRAAEHGGHAERVDRAHRVGGGAARPGNPDRRADTPAPQRCRAHRRTPIAGRRPRRRQRPVQRSREPRHRRARRVRCAARPVAPRPSAPASSFRCQRSRPRQAAPGPAGWGPDAPSCP